MLWNNSAVACHFKKLFTAIKTVKNAFKEDHPQPLQFTVSKKGPTKVIEPVMKIAGNINA